MARTTWREAPLVLVLLATVALLLWLVLVALLRAAPPRPHGGGTPGASPAAMPVTRLARTWREAPWR